MEPTLLGVGHCLHATPLPRLKSISLRLLAVTAPEKCHGFCSRYESLAFELAHAKFKDSDSALLRLRSEV